MKKKKKSKKKYTTDQEIVNWIGDYFCEVILPICQITGYKVFTSIKLDGEGNETFSVKVNFPYRRIDLYIRIQGIEWYKNKNIDQIRLTLFHEAFHILHWDYKEFAEARYLHASDLGEKEENLADHFSIIVEKLYQKSKKKK